MSATVKDELHRLIDKLPETEVQAARRFLEFLCGMSEDPLAQVLRRAPVDDEPETPEERAAVEKALRQVERGETIPHEEVLRRLGHGPSR